MGYGSLARPATSICGATSLPSNLVLLFYNVGTLT